MLPGAVVCGCMLLCCVPCWGGGRVGGVGYTTEFSGHFDIEPPLNTAEIDYLIWWSKRDHREWNEFAYCDWVPSADGTKLLHNGAEKSYGAQEWVHYIISNCLMPGAVMQGYPMLAELSRYRGFTFDHILNGTVAARGENADDRWQLIVTDNIVTTKELE